jgi:hypothetical protein
MFSRGTRASKGGKGATEGSARAETLAHLGAFVASHEGCEAFIEPPTRVTETTMIVIAETGEWTRRRVPDEATARKIAKHIGIPAYDINLSGYPSRMREWNERQRKSLG